MLEQQKESREDRCCCSHTADWLMQGYECISDTTIDNKLTTLGKKLLYAKSPYTMDGSAPFDRVHQVKRDGMSQALGIVLISVAKI